MNDPYLQNLFADRIGGKQFGKSNAVYKFAKIKQAKLEACAAHPELSLIDMGVGEPDDMAFLQIVEKLCEEAAKPGNRGYADNGGANFLQAASRYMQNVFGVTIDPATEVLHSIGSKAALSILPAVFINPGDIVLMTVPGYPIFGTHAEYYGGEVYNLPLTEETGFLPDLASIPADVLQGAKVLVLNYPNNPTGATATLEFFKEAVDFALKHELLIVQDAAYAALVFDGEKPVSILQVPGAKDVAIELHSLSKSYNMTGWRIGWVCGNALAIKGYGNVKDNTDSGQFLGIQCAATAALDDPAITEKIAAKYSRRMDLLVAVLNKSGLQVNKPKGTFFLYAKSPSGAIGDGVDEKFENGEAFSQWLIRNELISTVPWDDSGSYVRFSVTFDAKGEEREQEIVDEIGARLAKYKFSF